MKCPSCGVEIKEGYLYCQKCGEEIRIVPDYEPEIFIELSESISSIAEGYEAGETSESPMADRSLKASEQAGITKEIPTEEDDALHNAPDVDVSDDQAVRAKRQKKPRKQTKSGISGMQIAVVLVAGTLFVAFFLFAIFRFNRYFDFDIQYANALALHDEGKYEESISIAKHALSINNAEDKTRLLISDDYYELKKYDESNAVLFAMLSEEDNPAIYDRIINNYLAVEDYDAIVELLTNAADEDLFDRYAMYFAEAPLFSKDGGDYEDDFKLTLSASAPGLIYYTTDGTEPDINSKVYQYPINIEEGDITISAVFVNEYGISSPSVSETYSVSYPVAKAPKLLVSSGSYEVPKLIRVEYPDNYKVYYTTNGSDPNEDAHEYKRALEMPIGSSEFRFVAYDDKGRMSDIVIGKYNLKMVCFIDLDTALNALKIQLMSKGENSLLNEYKCNYGYGYADNSFYLIDEYTYAGSKTGRKFAVDTKTGSIFEASWNSDKQDYSLSVV